MTDKRVKPPLNEIAMMPHDHPNTATVNDLLILASEFKSHGYKEREALVISAARALAEATNKLLDLGAYP